ncbi:MAG: type IVB secretion system protein IcmH/DotU [Thermodesulfobacteriota bacterium]
MTNSEQTKSNPLLECAATVLSLAALFRGEERGADLEEDFRERIMAGFAEMERLAFERQIGMETARHAKYALAAYVDETVLGSSWSGRLNWMSNPLQLEMFGTHEAGEFFFEKLNTLRQGGEINADLLELYYICLQLGFEGIYKMRGLEQLTALQVDLRGQIDHYRGMVDPVISLDGVPKAGVLNRVRREVPYWVIGVVCVSTIFFTYIGYSVVVHRAMDSSLTVISASNEDIVDFAANNYDEDIFGPVL